MLFERRQPISQQSDVCVSSVGGAGKSRFSLFLVDDETRMQTWRRTDGQSCCRCSKWPLLAAMCSVKSSTAQLMCSCGSSSQMVYRATFTQSSETWAASDGHFKHLQQLCPSPSLHPHLISNRLRNESLVNMCLCVCVCVRSRCEDNAGLYTALNLDNAFNLSGQADQLVIVMHISCKYQRLREL